MEDYHQIIGETISLMGCKYRCDNCGKEQAAMDAGLNGWKRPSGWYRLTKFGENIHEDTTRDMCCIECSESLRVKLGNNMTIW